MATTSNAGGRNVGTARYKAGNRAFFLDQYIGLLLLYFFNPNVTSLHGLREITEQEAVQRQLGGGKRGWRSALSEAGGVFESRTLYMKS